MRRPVETEVLISLYQIRRVPLAALARDYGLSEAAVYARLWRAGAITRDSKAMYHDDAAILAAFRRTGSMSAVVETMGCHFYTVRDTLARAGIAHPLARGA